MSCSAFSNIHLQENSVSNAQILGSSASFHRIFFLLLIIPLTGDTSIPPPRLRHSRANAPPHRLLSLCPRGSVSPVSSAASPPGGGAPWSPPGRRCCPGTTWAMGTTPLRRRPSPRKACWNNPCWSSAVLSGCWPCRETAAQLHSDSDLEEEPRGQNWFSPVSIRISCTWTTWLTIQWKQLNGSWRFVSSSSQLQHGKVANTCGQIQECLLFVNVRDKVAAAGNKMYSSRGRSLFNSKHSWQILWQVDRTWEEEQSIRFWNISGSESGYRQVCFFSHQKLEGLHTLHSS